VVGVFPGEVPLDAALVQDGELDMVGTLMYTGRDFSRAIELIAGGSIDPAWFVTHKFGIEDVTGGYRVLLERREPAMKVLVLPGG